MSESDFSYTIYRDKVSDEFAIEVYTHTGGVYVAKGVIDRFMRKLVVPKSSKKRVPFTRAHFKYFDFAEEHSLDDDYEPLEKGSMHQCKDTFIVEPDVWEAEREHQYNSPSAMRKIVKKARELLLAEPKWWDNE